MELAKPQRITSFSSLHMHILCDLCQIQDCLIESKVASSAQMSAARWPVQVQRECPMLDRKSVHKIRSHFDNLYSKFKVFWKSSFCCYLLVFEQSIVDFDMDLITN